MKKLIDYDEKIIDFCSGGATQMVNYISMTMIVKSIKEDQEYYKGYNGNGILDTKKFENFLKSFKINIVSHSINPFNTLQTTIFYGENFCGYIYGFMDLGGSVNFICNNAKIYNKILVYLKENFKQNPPPAQGKVYILVSGSDGIELESLGYGAIPINWDNYSKDLHAKISFMIEDINSETPFGRISILEGPPGTGKTFLIRGMIDACRDATFIFIPPSMIRSLGDPSLIKAFLDLRPKTKNENKEFKYNPIVLLCEDADSILTHRGGDNMDSISSLLNLTSGILGDVIDIRIIATTNARKSEFDEAIVRAGRLSQYININQLIIEDANFLFKKLMPNEETPNWEEEIYSAKEKVGFSSDRTPIKSIKLADVYVAAKKKGWKPPKNTTPDNHSNVDKVEEVA